MRKRVGIFLILFLCIVKICSQSYWDSFNSPAVDLKVLLLLEQGSPYAAVMYASGQREVLDITNRLLEEIDAYLELELWITKKATFLGKPITIYGDEEVVETYLEALKKY